MLEQLCSPASDPPTVMVCSLLSIKTYFYKMTDLIMYHAAQQILVVMDFVIAVMIRQDCDGGMMGREWLQNDLHFVDSTGRPIIIAGLISRR